MATNMTSLPKPNLSLHIHRVFPDAADEQFIKNYFHEKGYGLVHRVDLVPKQNGEFFEGFVHFSYWYVNQSSLNLQNQVLNRNEVATIYYNEYSYWILNECYHPSPAQDLAQGQIDTDDFNSRLTDIEILFERERAILYGELDKQSNIITELFKLIQNSQDYIEDFDPLCDEALSDINCQDDLSLSEKELQALNTCQSPARRPFQVSAQSTCGPCPPHMTIHTLCPQALDTPEFSYLNEVNIYSSPSSIVSKTSTSSTWSKPALLSGSVLSPALSPCSSPQSDKPTTPILCPVINNIPLSPFYYD